MLGWTSGLFAPFLLKLRLLDGTVSVREPDVLFISAHHPERFYETFAESPVDPVVEVLSSESRDSDRGQKFSEYEADGIAKYWLIDPDRQHAEFYQRQPSGAYEPVVPIPEGVYESKALPGLRVRLEWLWQSPPLRLSVVVALYNP